MKRDTLHNLLSNADAMGIRAAERSDHELVEQVRSKARRRKRVRLSLVAVGVMLVGVSGLLRLMPPPENPVAKRGDLVQIITDREAEAVKLQAEVFQLRQESQQREQLVRRLLEAERRGKLAAQLNKSRPSSDTLAAIRLEQDRSALILIHQAQRFDSEMQKRPEALEAYRRVVALFPQSQWADVARKRLDEMQG
jgi:hypothetical protein